MRQRCVRQSSDPDTQLMLAFQEGDEGAFETLFGRYRTRSLNIAYRFLNDREAAQDIAQEVFVKIYTSRRTYRPDAAFSTWLYRITANTCMDRLRKHKWHKAVSQEISESTPDPSASPEAHAESNELARHVRSAIASLPENQRMAVVLQRYEGLSYQEIADAMKTSAPAIESVLFRAKHALRARLSSYIEPDEPTPTAEVTDE